MKIKERVYPTKISLPLNEITLLDRLSRIESEKKSGKTKADILLEFLNDSEKWREIMKKWLNWDKELM